MRRDGQEEGDDEDREDEKSDEEFFSDHAGMVLIATRMSQGVQCSGGVGRQFAITFVPYRARPE
jgi:hypothetical protein